MFLIRKYKNIEKLKSLTEIGIGWGLMKYGS